ncbi:hypothetical protein D9M70_606250 [compost metagenome]
MFRDFSRGRSETDRIGPISAMTCPVCRKQRCGVGNGVDYTIGLDGLYRIAMVVAIGHQQHAHARRAGRLGVVFRVAKGRHR